MFCIRLCAQNDRLNEAEGFVGDLILNFCSTFERDLIQLGNLTPSGLYSEELAGHLMLKKKAPANIHKMFADTDDKSLVPFLLVPEVVGKERRNRLFLKSSYKLTNDTEQLTERINNKITRINLLKSYIEKMLIFEKDFDFFNEIRKLNDSMKSSENAKQKTIKTTNKHLMCTKTIKHDLQELVNEGFCKIVTFERLNYVGIKTLREIVVHCSRDLSNPEVQKEIDAIKEKPRAPKTVQKFPHENCVPNLLPSCNKLFTSTTH